MKRPAVMPRKLPVQLSLFRRSCLLLIGWVLSSLAMANTEILTAADARHLLSRTGLGVDHRELIHLTGKTRSYAIDYVMDGFSSTPAVPMPPWADLPAPLYWTRDDLSVDDRQLFDRRRDTELVELRQWWIDNMLVTDSPQTERMILFWHNHFATSYHGINRQTKALALQMQSFRENVIGDFRSLLKLMVRDPALLNYLDNLSNRKDSPNENLARELLELFTLGEGHFSQSAVSEAARALTGHAVSQNRDLTFEFRSWDYDQGQKTLFGNNAVFNADDLIDEILQQPATATHMAGKFWHAFVSDIPPPRAQLDALADTFRNSHYNIATLYRAILESQAFWHSDYRATMVKSPAQLFIGLARTLQFPLQQSQTIHAMMARSGMSLFAPPNVAGWPQGMAWITPGRLLNRQSSLQDLLAHDRHPPAVQPSGMMNNDMQMSAASNIPEPEPAIQLHIAAENYRGPARYRVELRAKDDSVLWQNSATEIADGHETTKLGRVKELSELPWQVVGLNAPAEALSQAQHLRVHFINDDAGNDGDRNLFVSGASMNDTWFDSAAGTQQSKCVPGSRYRAGQLYCNGYVDIAINPIDAPAPTQTPAAASAHVNWVRARPDQLDLTLTLQDLHAHHRYFPTFSFHLKARDGELPRLELNTFGCWPDCLSNWPSCAWQDPLYEKRKTLAFKVQGPGHDKTLQCHRNATTNAEHQLVGSLFRSALSLAKAAFSTPRNFNDDQLTAFGRWQKLLQTHDHTILAHHKDAPLLVIDPALKSAAPSPKTPHLMTPQINNLVALERSLLSRDLTLTDILIPGIERRVLPEFSGIASGGPAQELDAVVSHPIFQLH